MPDIRRSDAACFPAYADRGVDDRSLPPCHDCGRPSVGGNFIEFCDGSVMGKTIGVVQFSCGCDGSKSHMLTSKHLFPGWQIVRKLERGIYKLRHLTEAERERASRGNGS